MVQSQDIDQMAGVTSDLSGNDAVAMEMNIQPDNRTLSPANTLVSAPF
jgi:hypothetical protein